MAGFPGIRRRPFAGIAALGFGVFLIWTVVLANRGAGGAWWSFIHQIPYGDKLGHFGLAGILSLLCNLAFSRRTDRSRFITLTTGILLIVISLEELSQAFIPSRHLDAIDWLADLAGLFAGQFLARRAAKIGIKSNQITRDHNTLR